MSRSAPAISSFSYPKLFLDSSSVSNSVSTRQSETSIAINTALDAHTNDEEQLCDQKAKPFRLEEKYCEILVTRVSVAGIKGWSFLKIKQSHAH